MRIALLCSDSLELQLIKDCLYGHNRILPHHSDPVGADRVHPVQPQKQASQHLLQISIRFGCFLHWRQLLHSCMQTVGLGNCRVDAVNGSVFCRWQSWVAWCWLYTATEQFSPNVLQNLFCKMWLRGGMFHIFWNVWVILYGLYCGYVVNRLNTEFK